jgi:heme exporter protein C
MSTTSGELLTNTPKDSQEAASLLPKISLLGLAGAFMIANIYLIFMWAPVATSAHRFNLQRIFYFHVPLAIVSFEAFFLVLIGSVLYLWRRNSRWDSLAHAGAEIGVIFATLALVTGSIWAKGIWDRWWSWDPKLTTTLILWLIYVGYLVLRGYAPSQRQGARFAAVVGIIGFVDVPIIYFASQWWGGLHPETVAGPLAAPNSLNGSMFLGLLFSMVTFTLLLLLLVWQRISQHTSKESLQQIAFSVRGFHDT